MSDVLLDELSVLLRTSITMWSLDDAVQLAALADEIEIQSGSGMVLRIVRAPPEMPFGWVVTIDGRKRTAASVVGVLRILRQSLAPGYQPYQLTMTPLPGHPA
ncbi:MAG: hypothetical protein AAGD43_29345 [Pseudomonadota bacterium]